MARPSARRPLPALAFLLGLSLLTALVWWRVIHRADADTHPKANKPCPVATPTVLPQPTAVTMDVLNSTQRNGLATSTTAALRKAGFKVTSVGNDTSGLIPGVADIRFGPQGQAAATLLSLYLPGATLVPNARTDAQVEISLGTQFKAVATAAQVKAALAAKHLSQSPVAHPTPKTTPKPSKTPTTKATKTTKAPTPTATC